MTDTQMLTDRESIRDWAAARMGFPAVRQPEHLIGADDPVLTFVFDQHAYHDQDQGTDRPPLLGGFEIIEWDDWFEQFNRMGLGLVVAKDQPGVRENFFELVKR